MPGHSLASREGEIKFRETIINRESMSHLRDKELARCQTSRSVETTLTLEFSFGIRACMLNCACVRMRVCRAGHFWFFKNRKYLFFKNLFPVTYFFISPI